MVKRTGQSQGAQPLVVLQAQRFGEPALMTRRCLRQVGDEGIEDLQIEYAVDADGNGSVDASEFVAAPADWRQVIGVRLGVLSASPEAGRGPVGARTFALPGKSIAKADDRIKRRGYTTTIMFETPTARRQS